MYLKTLHVVGFKSFADKTQIEFLPGVTAIVGPNGCGKSNVSDAIRWVLGEQSAKALRGGEMADVIFNGTDGRKPFGMAEVSLTFTECKDVLKTGQLAESEINFDEVTITRRIFRDGNSEYFLNKTPCRLRDVQTLFMDTGIGRSSYSIMEQGKIDKILSAHPEDRRSIFEEAAGITKFKSQKKEALRKLEYTEANLLRVTDVIREVKRQIGSLQRQVSKAKRYQAILMEIKHLDTQLARYEYEQIQSITEKLENEISVLKARVEDLRLEIQSGEGSVTNLRQQIEELDEKRQQILHARREVQSNIERQDHRIRTNTDRISETQTAIENSEREMTDSRGRSVEIQNRLNQIRGDLETGRQKLEGQRSGYQQSKVALEEAEKLERDHGLVLKDIQSRLLSLEGTLANLNNQSIMLEKQRVDFGNRIQKLTGEKTTAQEEKEKLTRRLDSLRTEVSSYKNTFEACRDAVLGGEEELHRIENDCQHLSAQIVDEQRKLSEKTSRRDVLRQLQQSYEGYSEGARAVLKQIAEARDSVEVNGVRDQIRGALANLIQVEPRYTGAIEAVLGQKLESIVVSDLAGAFQFVNQLKNREMGRAQFVIQNELQPTSTLPAHREPLEGTLRWAREVVQCDPAVETLMSMLLADTVIVPEIHQAVEFRRRNPGMTLVTLEGDVLDHYGILTAGSSKCASLHLIGQRNEITTLDEEISKIDADLRDLSSKKGELEGRRALARQSLGSRQSDLRFQENDLTKKEALMGVLQSELNEFGNRISTIELELQELNRALRENEENQIRIQGELTRARSDQEGVKRNSMEAHQKAEELARIRGQKTHEANELKVLFVTTQQQIESMESQIQPQEKQLLECQQFITGRENEVRLARQRIVQWEGENAEAAQLIQSLQTELNSLAEQLGKLECDKNQLDRELETVGENLRELRQKIDEIQSELTNHEVRLTEKRGDRNHLQERIYREYQVELSGVQLQTLETLMDSIPAVLEKMEESESAEKPAENSDEGNQEQQESRKEKVRRSKVVLNHWDDVALRVAELRAKLQSMGPVNLEAVQEYEELEQRYQFLTKEHEDLVVSKDQLHEIIKKINVTTRQMFADTFVKIRENFKQIFTELFGGGKSDLLLSDESDPLECGIEIVAKPPGKQLQSIMLLSGGERTMTAVSLLFAIYMVKPSPFCVLDEMDAPLDESNINRFIKMLERFLEHSQFVIITHNKRTIGMADALYGVTMEERGVSKIVSVKFHKKDEPKGGGRGNPGSQNEKLLVEVPSLDA